MKIGIISDTHDREEKTAEALKIIKEKGANTIVHCGDFCAPFMMNILAEFDGEIHCIFGNIDDRFKTPKRAESLGIKFHGDIAELEFNDKKIAANHYPKLAEGLASTEKYDAVFYGHNHIADKRKIGKTLLCNPGELAGVKNKPSFAIYDTETNDAEIIEIQ